MVNLEGRIALITGSGQGIGKHIAVDFARYGATVITNDISEDRAENTLEEIRQAGGDGTAFTNDVTDAEQVDSMVKQVIDTYGQIDILVNNAGTTRDTLLMRMSEEDWDIVIDTNLKGTFNCIKAVSRQMMRQRYGRIVNITSVAGLVGNAGQANYASAKAGLVGLTKTVAKELGSRGITCNAVAPGYVLTDLTSSLPPELIQQAVDRTPVGRAGTTEDMAAAVAFLASDDAAFVTGQVLAVDGGLSIS
jgi:3-oxoacyl-[acyl-carrier protein] reductase